MSLIINPVHFFGGAGGPPTSVTFFDSITSTATGSSPGINWPAGILEGDIAISLAFKGGVWAVSPSNTTWSDFTFMNRSNDGAIEGNGRTAFFGYRVCNGTESGTAVANCTGGWGALTSPIGAGRLIVIFRPNRPATSVSFESGGGQITTANPTAQNVEANGQTPPLIVLSGYASTGAIDPRTFTPAKDGEVGGGINDNQMWIAYKIYNTGDTPADHSIDMDDEGINYLASRYILIT